MGFESLSPGLLAWVACVILAAGLIQGALGFGFPFVATPLIAMVSDMRTAIIVVLLPTLATIVVALAASGPIRTTLARFWMMPLYMIAGATAGTSLFVYAPDFPYSLLLALITLVYLNLDRLGLGESPVVRRHERRFGVVSGLAAGVFEGTANVAGPPLIIFYLALGLTPAMMVQAMNICFLVGKTHPVHRAGHVRRRDRRRNGWRRCLSSSSAWRGRSPASGCATGSTRTPTASGSSARCW